VWAPPEAGAEMKMKIKIKTAWDMEYRIWDIDRADEERLKTTDYRLEAAGEIWMRARIKTERDMGYRLGR
jgi:hypothetical protein